MKSWLIKKLGGYTKNELEAIKFKVVNDVLNNTNKYKIRIMIDEALNKNSIFEPNMSFNNLYKKKEK